METITQKKLQAELEYLRKRKAKADELGPEVIARTQVQYDGIVARIRELEAELGIGAAPDKPVNHCMAVLPHTFALFLNKWLGMECRPDMDSRYSQALEAIGLAFERILAAVQADDVAAHADAWTALDTAVGTLVVKLKDDNTTRQLGFTEVESHVECPFDQKCTA